MMAVAPRRAHPFAPLVIDDAGSLEAMAAAVMRLHSTLITVGRCYTTDATGDRAALELGRVESVLAGAFCTIFGQSPADRFADIFDQVTYVADHMVKDHIFEDGNKRTSLVFALSVLRLVGAPVVLSDALEPKDNQYYAWIQDLVSSRRTNSELAEELRRGCVVGSGDSSRV
jgi:death-on-curing protein